MSDEMVLAAEHRPYARASATNVQRTWKKHGWVPPSKDPAVVAKWDYFKAIALLSEQAFERDCKP
jgi:hypothetical protein